MKIKCPACSKVLNIPESAAGKIVKCPCGKQLRAPGGAGGAAAAPKTAPPTGAAGAGAAGTGSAGVGAKRPAAAKPAAAVGGFDADMLDELTDQDLQPVKSVSKVGKPRAVPKKGSSEAALQKYAGDQDRRGEALIHQGLSPRPGFLMFLGIVNACWGLLYFGIAVLMMGFVAMFPAMEEIQEEMPEAGLAFTIIIIAAIVMGILSVATAVSCFVRGRVYWYILAFSYSYGFTDRVFGVIGEFMGEEEVGGVVVGSIIGIVIGLALWAYMHGEEVRAFHGSEEETMGKIVAINLAGIAFGCCLSGAAVFLAQ